VKSALFRPLLNAPVQYVVISFCLLALQLASANPIIHEIHYDPDSSLEPIEYIELRNTNSVAVNLSEWFMDEGVDARFPAGVSIPGYGYLLVAQDRQAVANKFGVSTSKIYQWRSGSSLANSGETIRLRRADGTVADRVKYGAGDEWPITTSGSERSLQLISQHLDRDQIGAWRIASPTPLSANSAVYTGSPSAKVIYDKVKHSPKSPTSTNTVTVSVQIAQAPASMTATLQLQKVTPGNYVAKTDSGYGIWASMVMSATTNGTWEATVPASYMQHRNLVRYRIRLNAPNQAEIILPPPANDNPNFAFFVYDGLSNYGSTDLSALEQVPVYHLIAKSTDVANYISSGSFTTYPITGTLVHNGKVYDHVRYRSKGRSQRHDRIKNNIKFKANKGQKIAHRSDQGKKLQDKGNFMIYGGTLAGAEGVGLGRADSGLSEGIALEQFRLFGAYSSSADWMHFRVIDSANENPSNPANGDFWGIYNIVSDYSKDWMQDMDLPQSYLYEWKDFAMECTPPTGPFTTNNALYTAINNTRGSDWSIIDSDTQMRFNAANEGLMQQEPAYWGKHYQKLYHHPDRGWFLMPSDMDYTMLQTTGQSQAIFGNTTPEYRSVLREYLDLVLNGNGIETLIEEKASRVHRPNAGTSLAHLDRDRWGLSSYYSNFDSAKSSLKNYFSQRADYIRNNLATDNYKPSTPSVSINHSNLEADSFSLQASNYNHPYGYGREHVQFQVAEYTPPNQPPAAGQAWHYEAKPTWRSAPITSTSVSVPQGVIQGGKRYRARVRYKDNTDRWSHWSSPKEFVAAPGKHNMGAVLVINEIHYNPYTGPGIDDDEREFIELRNLSGSSFDLSGYSFSDGISCVLEPGTRIEANGYLVIAGDAEEFARHYGFPADAEFKKGLNNGGERIALVDAWGTLVDEVDYGDGNSWGPGADGYGPSLELMDASLDNDQGDNWLAIGPAGGTPRAPNSVECNQADDPDLKNIVITEINYDSAANADAGDWIELHNKGTKSVVIYNWTLADGLNSYKFGIVSIPAGGYRVIAEFPALFQAQHPGVSVLGPLGYSLSNGGEPLVLLNEHGCLADMVIYDDDLPWETMADGNGATLSLVDPSFDNEVPWSWVAGANGGTPGASNNGGNFAAPCTPAPPRVVINEINVDSSPHLDPGDWIEFYNATANLVDLSDWHLYDEDSRFDFPANTFLAPNQYLIMAEDYFGFQAVHPNVGVQVVNGNGFTLNGGGERLVLTSNGGCVVDDLTYDNVAPWPTGLGTGGTLALRSASLDNALPASWSLSDGFGSPGKHNSADACATAGSEISIQSATASGVVLKNMTGANIPLDGWVLANDNNKYAIPAGTSIAAGQSLTINAITYPGQGSMTLYSVRRCVADEYVDTDGDGYPDPADLFPTNPDEWADSDNDGIGDNADRDSDNDGLSDEVESRAIAASTPITSWNNASSGMTASGNKITYNSGASWSTQINSARMSTFGFTSNYELTFKCDAVSGNYMVGLGNTESSASWNDIDMAFYITGGSLRIYENGSSMGTIGSINAGDTLGFRVEGTSVRYLQNGNVVRTKGVSSGQNYYIDTSFGSGQGTSISNFELSSLGGAVVNVSLDHDGDGYDNRFDLDSDNDTIPDVIEAGLTDNDLDANVDVMSLQASVDPAPDSDNDGIPDFLDLESNNPLNNGTAYDIDTAGNGQLDTNGDGMLDGNDASGGQDLNNNGIPDGGESHNFPEPEIDRELFKATGQIKFNCQPGMTYQVQCCDDLVQGTWTLLQTINATGESAVYTDPNAGPVMCRVYRIRRM